MSLFGFGVGVVVVVAVLMLCCLRVWPDVVDLCPARNKKPTAVAGRGFL
jgi:hypothetical protein